MRQWMIEKREALGLTRRQMAKKCMCSDTLLGMLENADHITHPDIASQIAIEYDLTLDEYNSLVHEDRRVKEIPKKKQQPTVQRYYEMKYGRQKRYKEKQR